MLIIFLKALLNMLQYCFYFFFVFFFFFVFCVCVCDKSCGDCSSLTRDWTYTPALESEVLTTEPPGKSQ